MNSTRKMGLGMQILAWLSFLLLLGLFFQDQLEEQINPNRELAQRQSGLSGEVVLERNRQGHYISPGWINGHPVTFLLDTGATDVSVPAHIAQTVGLKREAEGRAMTANGVITVYRTHLDSVELGGIRLHDVRASINPGMPSDTVLLGMSFMKHLELVQRGDRLTLRQVE